VIAGAIVFDGEKRLGQADVHVADGLIVSVGRPPVSGVEVIDAAGATLLPGLIDAHTHTDADQQVERRIRSAQASVCHSAARAANAASEPSSLERGRRPVGRAAPRRGGRAGRRQDCASGHRERGRGEHQQQEDLTGVVWPGQRDQTMR
jgi:predicted amidohydrolase YtcJ